MSYIFSRVATIAYEICTNAGSRRGVNDIRRHQSLVEIVKCYRYIRSGRCCAVPQSEGLTRPWILLYNM